MEDFQHRGHPFASSGNFKRKMEEDSPTLVALWDIVEVVKDLRTLNALSSRLEVLSAAGASTPTAAQIWRQELDKLRSKTIAWRGELKGLEEKTHRSHASLGIVFCNIHESALFSEDPTEASVCPYGEDDEMPA
ncbi:MAG: hypothetical protein Q9208_001403 [Pyrenodesmia sp. 3 TL-2023]